MAKSSVAKKRKCKEEYTHFGFTMTKSSDGDERPQCILCNVLFCNANMKPSRLKEHFNNKHEGVKPGQDLESLKIIKEFASIRVELFQRWDLYQQISHCYLPPTK